MERGQSLVAWIWPVKTIRKAIQSSEYSFYQFVYVCKAEETKSRNYWFGGEDDTISFNLKLFQNFFKNPIVAEEHGRKADLAYGSSLEVVKIRYNLQTYLFFC